MLTFIIFMITFNVILNLSIYASICNLLNESLTSECSYNNYIKFQIVLTVTVINLFVSYIIFYE
jgi:hypothetical protein